MKKHYEEKLAALVKKHGAERVELEDKAASTLESKELTYEELSAKIRQARNKLGVEKRDSRKTQERYETELSDLRGTHTKNLERAEQEKLTALAQFSQKSKEILARAVELERKRLHDEGSELRNNNE